MGGDIDAASECADARHPAECLGSLSCPLDAPRTSGTSATLGYCLRTGKTSSLPAALDQAYHRVVKNSDNAGRLVELLASMDERCASDLYICEGKSPAFRVHGEVKSIEESATTPGEVKALLDRVLVGTARARFDRSGDLDVGYSLEDGRRFRLNLAMQQGRHAIVARAVPSGALTFSDLRLPDVVRGFAERRRGLVIVTGATGSGKSTTLAAMVDLINEERQDHILTIEDPIEFTHPNKKCLVNQREISTHTKSFANALRAALREDPDVILVGEMRDRETIELGITAAETGHLVFGTLHTSSAPKTVDRIIGVFPADQQEQIRAMLAESLKGVIAQVLLKTKDGKGRRAALEIMVGTPAINNLVRENKIHQIPSIIQTGKKDGMQMLDQHILEFLMSGVITAEEAYMKCNNKQSFRQYLDSSPSEELT
jgi:twitching motility protein PilT